MIVHNYLAVIGRIPGDDEDSAYLYESMTRREAVVQFEKDIYNDGEGNMDRRDRAKEDSMEAHGCLVYITFVLYSNSPIEVY